MPDTRRAGPDRRSRGDAPPPAPYRLPPPRLASLGRAAAVLCHRVVLRDCNTHVRDRQTGGLRGSVGPPRPGRRHTTDVRNVLDRDVLGDLAEQVDDRPRRHQAVGRFVEELIAADDEPGKSPTRSAAQRRRTSGVTRSGGVDRTMAFRTRLPPGRRSGRDRAPARARLRYRAQSCGAAVPNRQLRPDAIRERKRAAGVRIEVDRAPYVLCEVRVRVDERHPAVGPRRATGRADSHVAHQRASARTTALARAPPRGGLARAAPRYGGGGAAVSPGSGPTAENPTGASTANASSDSLSPARSPASSRSPAPLCSVFIHSNRPVKRLLP